jgi:hypothetical protein
MFYGILSLLVLLNENKVVDDILKIFKLWPMDSAGNETLAQIKTESRFFSFLVIVNLILTLIAAILFIVPFPYDEEVYFAMYLFDRWFPSCAPILKWFYRLTILVVAFAIVNSAHMFLYITEQLKFQTYLLLKHVDNITSLEEYCDDGLLIKNKHYQIAIERRIKFCIKRHIELIKYVSESVSYFFFKINFSVISDCIRKVRKWIPLFAIIGILIFLSCIFYFFFHQDLSIGRNLRVGGTFVAGVFTFCLLIFTGQSVENQTDVLHRINGNILWTTLDKKNLRLLMTMTLVLKTPIKLKFSENVIVNYEIGIKIIKAVYSAVCFFLQIRSALH